MSMPIDRRRFLAACGGATLLAMSDMTSANTTAPAKISAADAGSIAIAPDVSVNRLGFGAMRITGPREWGPPADVAAMKAVLRRALDLGTNFIDTADAYGPHVSEELIAAALHPYPAGLVIATKGGIVRPSAPEWVANGRPAHLRAACEGSLKRLRVARIGLYYLHAVDPQVPLADSLGELVRLQAEGKIHHIGISNVTVDELRQARAVATIASVQNSYSAANRRSEDVLIACEQAGIAFVAHTPLARGALTPERRNAKVDALERVARARGISMAQVALAWLLTRSRAVLPIPGTSSIRHLEENVSSAPLRLSADEMKQIG